MRNRDRWQPSKYVRRNGRLVASRDPREVNVASRLGGDLVAGIYDTGLRRHAKGKLLDLGCGKVPFFGAYKDLVTDCVCADWSHTPHTSGHLDRECDLTQALPFGDGEFDTILLSDVLEHIPTPEHLFGEMARVLAKGGRILLNVPFCYGLHEQPHDYYRYTEFALRRFAEGAGLRLLELAPIGGTPEVLADLIAKNVVRVPVIGRAVAILVQWLVFGLTRAGFGKRISDGTKAVFPLGYFLVAEKPA